MMTASNLLLTDDSVALGTGQLVGLAGKMAISIVEKHFYEFEYTLP